MPPLRPYSDRCVSTRPGSSRSQVRNASPKFEASLARRQSKPDHDACSAAPSPPGSSPSAPRRPRAFSFSSSTISSVAVGDEFSWRAWRPRALMSASPCDFLVEADSFGARSITPLSGKRPPRHAPRLQPRLRAPARRTNWSDSRALRLMTRSSLGTRSLVPRTHPQAPAAWGGGWNVHLGRAPSESR